MGGNPAPSGVTTEKVLQTVFSVGPYPLITLKR